MKEKLITNEENIKERSRSKEDGWISLKEV